MRIRVFVARFIMEGEIDYFESDEEEDDDQIHEDGDDPEKIKDEV